MKKLIVRLAVLFSGYATNSFAALPMGTSKCDVCVANYCGGFTFGLTGLYWRPSVPYLDYALTYPADATDGLLFTNGGYHSVDHDYDWGFKVNIGYVFPCSGNDVNLTYTHWDSDDNDSVRDFAVAFPATAAPFFAGAFPAGFSFGVDIPITGTGSIVGSVFAGTIPSGTPIPFNFTPGDLIGVSARSNVDNRTWDLDFGQAINAGCNFRLHWFGGLRYSRVEHDLDVTHEYAAADTSLVGAPHEVAFTIDTPVTPTIVVTGLVVPVFDVAGTLRDVVNQKSEFQGIGPRFGFDASYHLGGGFGVAGSLSTAILVGEHDSTYSERLEVAGTATLVGGPVTVPGVTTFVELPSFPPPLTVTTVDVPIDPSSLVFSYRHPDETRVVPNIDAKLGLDWTYQFSNSAQSKVIIEAGYMVSHYFNAIDRLSQLGAIASEVRSRQTIDLSFDGPYVGVQVNL